MAKWTADTTIKFIQEYKSHSCLWDFKSADYKNKQMRETALLQIVEAMAISGFGVPEAKNKIKNLRSTYGQEMKKVKDSKKTGCLYKSNVKWLKDMESVYMDDDQRKTYYNSMYNWTETTEDNSDQTPANDTAEEYFSPENKNKRLDNSNWGECKESQSQPKRKKELFQAISDLKSLNESISERDEDAQDVFGRSVAMQLKALSEENMLLAQCRIQNILTEIGIKNLQEKNRICVSELAETHAESCISSVSSLSPGYYSQHTPTSQEDPYDSESNVAITLNNKNMHNTVADIKTEATV